jgi:CRP-like cAMP-binding protein
MAEFTAGLAVDTLRRCELFSELSDGQIAELASLARERFCDPGEVVFSQNDPATNLYVVESGRVSLMLALPDGHEISVLDVGPAGVFGWASLVEPTVYTGTARCTHESALVELPAADLEKALLRDPDAAYTVMKKVAGLVSVWLRDSRMQLIEALRD